MKITSNIFQVGGQEESHSSDASIYLIADRGEVALVDSGTGLGHNKLMENIQKLGIAPGSIKYLFLTHCHYDHTGGAYKLRKATGCKIIAHKLDAVYIEEGDNDVTAASWYGTFMEKTPVDIKVETKEAEFIIGSLQIRFYHTPGHSPGSSVLSAVSDGKLVLFGQDVHGPLNESLLSNRKEYVDSLEFLLSLEADILCEGHFGVYYDKDVVSDFIGSFL
ncbi:MAG: MBL fold metallo-hydrolase [Spirochaetes bacterium]|nr:MBL fold metallo-hydrolase [Spirochaetota bacterium]